MNNYFYMILLLNDLTLSNIQDGVIDEKLILTTFAC